MIRMLVTVIAEAGGRLSSEKPSVLATMTRPVPELPGSFTTRGRRPAEPLRSPDAAQDNLGERGSWDGCGE
jgi:hypothetical protein